MTVDPKADALEAERARAALMVRTLAVSTGDMQAFVSLTATSTPELPIVRLELFAESGSHSTLNMTRGQTEALLDELQKRLGKRAKA